MNTIDDCPTRSKAEAAELLKRLAKSQAADLECISRSREAIAISRELLSIPLYRPMCGLRRPRGGR
ncbi:hypothetical protein QA634_34715 [Methylobacterium sp. CB376]|uniref:hypothetical protein n=1 Tax=unclassified Methylobacterium TaxID=2615210 RepID=UPI0003082BDE|nr:MULTISPECIES: hypothetical protein [Methylobacterium]WFT80265.1 hypothetical protein QA634_34715 [Methylobacterium nodulans]